MAQCILTSGYGMERFDPYKTTVIGRGSFVDMRLCAENISRRHAEVIYDTVEHCWFIRDMKSTNGTIVNGEYIDCEVWHPLLSGDSVIIGDCNFIFQG